MAVVYAALPAACMWWPFVLTDDVNLVRERLAHAWRLPFASIVNASPLTGFTLLTERILMYVPLGFLLGRALYGNSMHRRSTFVYSGVVFVAIAAFALIVEAGQVLIPSRYPDPTDILLASIGGTAGALLARTAVRSPTPATAVAPFRRTA
jgi:glycopeptide antibiotics resistance protein